VLDSWGGLPKIAFCKLPGGGIRPDSVFVFNSKGDGMDHLAHGAAFQRLGFLGPDGQPPTVEGDIVINSEETPVGRVIRDAGTGEVIGWRNVTGLKEAYDLSSSATFDQAMGRIGPNGGCVVINKHGNAGMIVLDRGNQYAGFGPDIGGGGTGILLNPYPITSPAGPATVHVNTCHSALDPDGALPAKKAVTKSLKDINPDTLTVLGHNYESATCIGLEPEGGDEEQAMENLRAKAASYSKYRDDNGDTGINQILDWIADLPFEKQYNTVQQIANAGCTIKLTYTWRNPPIEEGDTDSSVVLAVYHMDPTLVGSEGDTLVYRNDTLDVADDVRVEIEQGDLAEHRVFWIKGILNDYEELPGIVVGGVYELTPEDSLPCNDPITVALKFHWHIPEQLNMFRKPAGGTWERVLDERSVEMFRDSLGTLSVNVVQLGRFAIAIDSSAVDVPPNAPIYRFELLQSFPNPANPYAVIRFSIARPDRVRLRVFDVSGRVIRTLIDENFPAGDYERVWDGKNDRGKHVGSGVFFYQLEASNFKSAKKIVILQ
jgi:hypothetical protein